jgi:hypothetical protein
VANVTIKIARNDGTVVEVEGTVEDVQKVLPNLVPAISIPWWPSWSPSIEPQTVPFTIPTFPILPTVY